MSANMMQILCTIYVIYRNSTRSPYTSGKATQQLGNFGNSSTQIIKLNVFNINGASYAGI